MKNKFERVQKMWNFLRNIGFVFKRLKIKRNQNIIKICLRFIKIKKEEGEN